MKKDFDLTDEKICLDLENKVTYALKTKIEDLEKKIKFLRKKNLALEQSNKSKSLRSNREKIGYLRKKIHSLEKDISALKQIQEEPQRTKAFFERMKEDVLKGKKKIKFLRKKNLALKRKLKRKSSLENRLDYSPIKTRFQDSLGFKTSTNKSLFLAWNNLGTPFRKHRKSGKTFYCCIQELDRLSRKINSQKVIETFEAAKKIFNDPSFKFHKRMINSKYKISLQQFLGKDKDFQKRFKLEKSWFDEFLKGENSVKNKFSFYQNEIDPKITEILKKAWIQYKQGQVDADNSDFQQKMIRFSNLFVNFSKTNEIDPYYLGDIFKKALNEWHTIKLNRLNFALSPSFYSETIPEELKRYSPLHFQNKRFRSEWKELTAS